MALVVGAIAYGLALYVVNFVVLGSLVFELLGPFVEGGPNQIFVHPAVFGVLLIPFFLHNPSRSNEATVEAGAVPLETLDKWLTSTRRRLLEFQQDCRTLPYAVEARR